MASRPTVALTCPLPPAWIADLTETCRVLEATWDAAGPLAPAFLQRAGAVEGILCTLEDRIDGDVLDRFPRLRVVATMSVGYDHIDLAACRARGIAVGHTPGVLTEATADLTFALLLAVARRIPSAAEAVLAGRWGRWRPAEHLGMELSGRTLGIVGLGKIGRAVARRARAFGMDVVFTRRHRSPDPVGLAVDLAGLAETADVVSLHVPLTPQTRRLVDRAFLARMKPGAILVNTSRGPVVDTGALLDALRNGCIAGAGLDVTDPEPLPPSHPLLDLPNVVVTPHIGSATETTRMKMARLTVGNLLAGLAGKPLPHPVPTS